MSADRPGEPLDGGSSLVEVMVSMAVMSLFAAVFTGALVGTFQVFNSADAETVTQSETSDVYLTLDREIRYASGISLPAVVQGHWYVEYLIKDGTVPTCVELRLPDGGGSLQRRSWPQGGTVPVFTNRIQNVGPVTESGGTIPPLTRTAVSADQDYQRLRLYLIGDADNGGGTDNPLDFTFTAANTSGQTSSDTICTEARGVNP